LLERAFEQITDIRIVKKHTIENFFLDRERDARILSSTLEMMLGNDKTIASFESESGRLQENQQNNLRDIFSSGYYSGFSITLHDQTYRYQLGDTSLSMLNVSENTDDSIETEINIHTIEMSQTTFFQDYTKNTVTDEYELRLISPFKISSDLVGYLTLNIPLSMIHSVVSEASVKGGFGESGETYLVGSDYRMRSNSRFQKNSVMNIIVHTTGVEKALAGSEGSEILFDYRNIKVLSSFCPLNIHGLQWVLLSEIDFSEVLLPVKKALNL